MFSFLRGIIGMGPSIGRTKDVPALLTAGIAMLSVSIAGSIAEDLVPVEIITAGFVCDG